MTDTDPLRGYHSGLRSPELQQALHQERAMFGDLTLNDLFNTEPTRFDEFSCQAGDLLLDYSKTHLRQQTRKLLVSLANASDLVSARNALFRGAPINLTEHRAAWHCALRSPALCSDAEQRQQIAHCQQRMIDFTRTVLNGDWVGYTGKPINRVVNIGIGGSDLGPSMAVTALRAYQANAEFSFAFVSNIDPTDISLALAASDPERTLFIIASKTFTTQETLKNAHQARAWFLAHAGDQAAVKHHFVAVSTNLSRVTAFGIDPANAFPLWDWVGGRYSIWSAIGLPLMLALGEAGFNEFLSGGRMMDEHFRDAPFDANMPVLLALIGLWYGQFFNSQSQAVICYEHSLNQFTAYLQQLDMESNGKSVRRDGTQSPWQTGVPLWGGVGSNTQHSFHQLFHQGNTLVPVDFIVGCQSLYPRDDMHDYLFANCLAQSRAMMVGRDLTTCKAELRAQGLSDAEVATLAPHKVLPGNKPSNTLIYPLLTPAVLGQLIALYEHKVFVQSILWEINAFDQWGVELGKTISNSLIDALHGKAQTLDGSTQGLLARYQRR